MIVGLTGGIGSGKSTVAGFFKQKGIPIYISDIEAKKIMHTSVTIQKQIISVFGSGAYVDGKLNRSYLADKVFKNKDLLNTLNGIVHPEVQKHFLAWYKKQTSLYVIKEAAILFESGSYKHCDAVITVTAPPAERIKRVIERDQVRQKDVEARMSNQWPDEKRIKLSDYVINNTDINFTKSEVDRIHKELIEKINKK